MEDEAVQDEKRLVRRIQQGDKRAFEAFLDAYGASVHRLVRRYVANPADAEDMTQEIFVDLYRSIGGFRGESSLATWVYRVAVNRCLRHCQRTRPDNAAEPDALDTEPATDWRVDPAQSAAKSELSDRVQCAVRQLSPLHQDVVILCEMHGLTYAECANVLEIPVGTVKSRLSNAFRRLRLSLRGYVLNEDAANDPQPVLE